MKLNLTTFENTQFTVDAIEIFFEKFEGRRTIWISENKTDQVLVVVEANGTTRTFPFDLNVDELKLKKIYHESI